jgi:RecG-like helicase
VFKILLRDASGKAELLWFHYRKPHLMRFTAPGTELLAFGTIRINGGRHQIIHPELSTCDGSEDHLGFYPVYPFIAGISRTLLRATIKKALDECLGKISDPLPENIVEALGLPDSAKRFASSISLPPIPRSSFSTTVKPRIIEDFSSTASSW